MGSHSVKVLPYLIATRHLGDQIESLYLIFKRHYYAAL